MSADAADNREIEPVYDVSIPQLGDVEDPPRPCVLSGRVLEAGALMEMVSFIAQSTWRGELVVSDGVVMRSLFFDEGLLVAAESTAPEERLREVLLKHGLLSREQVAACEAVTVTRALRFGEAAVELELASREAVFGWLAVQVDEIAFALLRADRGAFAFFRGYEDARPSFRRKQAVSTLLERVLQDANDVRWFRSKIRASTDIPTKMMGRPEPTRDPLGLYASIDGTKNVAELARTIGASELDVTRALYQHVQSGHATVSSKRLNDREIVQVYNRAILVLLRELDAMDEGDGVRSELATFAGHAAERPRFVDAPADDGTLDAEAIEKRLEGEPDRQKNADHLSRWLYEYASYALFLARPHLERRYAAADSTARVSRQVAELLEPLAPTSQVVVPPSGRAPRLTLPAPSSGFSKADAAPRSSKTMRIHRALVNAIPGIDPSRTARLAPFSSSKIEVMPISGTVPTPSSSLRKRTAVVAAGGARGAKRPSSFLKQARVPAMVVAALVVGIGIGWSAHPRTPIAISAISAPPPQEPPVVAPSVVAPSVVAPSVVAPSVVPPAVVAPPLTSPSPSASTESRPAPRKRGAR